MKRTFADKRYTGVLWSVLFNTIFLAFSLAGLQFLSGVPWFLYSGILRAVFGVMIIYAVNRIYGKSARETIHFQNWKSALTAGTGFIVYFVYFIALFLAGFKGIAGLSAGLFVSHILFQQITTGFYEELGYRLLILEGFFYQANKSTAVKLCYAAVSSVLFGAAHVVTGWSLSRFILTGIVGFAFAAVYLVSRNILIPMVLHFIYDVFANLAIYVEWNSSSVFNALNSKADIVLCVTLAISVIMLVKRESAADK